MKKRKSKICIVSAFDIGYLGGLSLYQKNLIKYLNKKMDLSLVYKGVKNDKKVEKDCTFFQIKTPRLFLVGNFFFEFEMYSFLKNKKFDVINSHGFTGLWMNFFRGENTKIIHTYHGSTYYFYKNHFKRFNLIEKIIYSPILLASYIVERSPWKKANKVICVSEHVKDELIKLYGKRKNVEVIRTSVDLKNFNLRNGKKVREKLKLDKNKIYGLYVGRGGFWTKGLDKVIKLSREIYLIDKNYRLIVIGADKKKVKHLLNGKFIIFLPIQSREKIPFYYNASDVFFNLSRYEGGAPTMVTSEAMASGCLIVTDKEARQEIIESEKNGIIVNKNYKEEAKRILDILKNKKKLKKILQNSQKTIKEISLEKWGEKYLKVLTD